MTSLRAVHVHLLPALIPPEALLGGVVVVVDVLRATTVMIQALSAGCEGIVACLEIDEARQIAAGVPPGTILLAGERQGLPIEGFDLGNSPPSFTSGRCDGKPLVMTTTNGTRAIRASLDADRVLVASFGNLAATAREMAGSGLDLHVVCSGTDGLISWEDTLLAGALLDRLESASISYNDEALMAVNLWRGLGIGRDNSPALANALRRGRGGQQVRGLGLDADIVEAARIDWFDRTAELRQHPIWITLNP